jgi:hypothetical protein
VYRGRPDIAAPPPSPRPQDPDPEALIEEARQRARRRRRLYGAAAAGLALLGVSLFVVFGRPEASQSASPEPPLVPIASDGEATVLARYAKLGHGWVFIYDDGRVIFNQYGHPLVDWHPHPYKAEPVQVVRRLTSHGLDLVRSGDLSASDFLRALSYPKGKHGDVSWDDGRIALPAGLWADPEFKPYVPPRYGVCAWVEPGGPAGSGAAGESLTNLLQGLPASVRALLRGKERTYHPDGDYYFPDEGWSWACFMVSAEEADVLEGPEVEVFPILPHGAPALPDGG